MQLGNDMTVCFSVVSHGQGHLVRNLLNDFRRVSLEGHEILVTLNVPEQDAFLLEYSDLPIRVLRNAQPKGFGANHNAAFVQSSAEYFVVVNPDIRFGSLPLQMLLSVFVDGRVGVCGPGVLSSSGAWQDNARRFPTAARLVRRKLNRSTEFDYVCTHEPIQVDWLAGMFMVFSRAAFRSVAGFDERYFMYYEDADICRRLAQRGYRSILHPGVTVVHDAQRDSRRRLRYFLWHLRSTVRFLYGW